MSDDESGRKEILVLRYKVRQLEMCSKLLDEAGVPEWVLNADSDNVPASAVPCRLRWFISRRKNVSPGETDEKLNRELALLIGNPK